MARCSDFFDFIQQVQMRRAELPSAGLVEIHDQVWRLVQQGDPTPFKAFRYNEYLATAARFGVPPGEALETALFQSDYDHGGGQAGSGRLAPARRPGVWAIG